MNNAGSRTKGFFLSRCTIRTSGCWEWPRRGADGYGTNVRNGGKPNKPHRLAYEVFIGPIQEGLTIDHLCRNKPCCNPWHLEPVTIQENLKRRGWKTKTHCVNGHELTAENSVWQVDSKRPSGKSRFCRRCRNERFRAMRVEKQVELSAYRKALYAAKSIGQEARERKNAKERARYRDSK